MKNEKYGYLRDQFPEQISLDQFYRICKISKRSAAWLVKNGIVPYTDTGKKTWRYRISIEDVIEYLRKRELYGSMIPPGVASSKRNGEKTHRRSYAEFSKQAIKSELEEYFGFIYADYPETLSAREGAEITGLRKETVYKYIRSGDIEIIGNGRGYILSKQHICKFMASRKFIECKSTSKYIDKLMRGFEIWRENCTADTKERGSSINEKL